MNVRLVLLCLLTLVVPNAARAQMISAPGVLVEATAVRISPSAAVPLATLPRGTDVMVLAVQENWVQVAFEDLRYGRRVGYVTRSSITFAMPGVVPAASVEPPRAAAVSPAPAPVPAVSKPAERPATKTSTPPTAPAVAAATPAGRPPVRLVEGAFPAATSSPATTAAKASAAPAAPAARPPVRLVESAFPAVAAAPAPVAPGESRPAPVAVVSIGNAFPDATTPRAATAVTAPAPAATETTVVKASSVEAPVAAADPTASLVTRPGGLVDPNAFRVARAPVMPKSGMPVTLMIPRRLLKPEGDGTSRPALAYSAEITGGAKRAAVNGVSDWMQAGLPSLLEASVAKVTRKKEYSLLEFNAISPEGANIVVTLRFPHSVVEPEAVLGQLIAEGAPDAPVARRYRDEAYAAVADLAFNGKLAGLPQERKMAILASLQDAAGAPDLHMHDGQVYSSFDLGSHERVFDDRSADEATIIAYALHETVMPQVRKLARSMASVSELHGMRVVYRIPHRATPRVPAKDFQLELIADTKQVLELVQTELTNQAFIDASRLVVDGKSVRINAAPFNPPQGN